MYASKQRHLLCQRKLRVCPPHGHSPSDCGGVCLKDDPAAMTTVYQPKRMSHAFQQTLPTARCTQNPSILYHPLSTVSSMASSTRSRFSSTVFFSTAPLHASDFEAAQADVVAQFCAYLLHVVESMQS
jgi:hypothetical protein